jgi:hypothetical protein
LVSTCCAASIWLNYFAALFLVGTFLAVVFFFVVVIARILVVMGCGRLRRAIVASLVRHQYKWRGFFGRPPKRIRLDC